MICLLQRVTQAEVRVGGEVIGQISPGLAVLCGFQPHDDADSLKRMAHKLLHYRVFADENDKMNLNVQQTQQGEGGDVLLVPQFTLPADTRKAYAPASTPRPHQRKPKRCLSNSFKKSPKLTAHRRPAASAPTCRFH